MTVDFLIYGIINTICVVLVAPLFVSLVRRSRHGHRVGRVPQSSRRITRS